MTTTDTQMRLRISFMTIFTTVLIVGLLNGLQMASAVEPRVIPPEPAPGVTADPSRRAAFELAQLRQGLAMGHEQADRPMSAALLRLQASVAYDQAAMNLESQQEMVLGLRQSSSLKFGFAPLRIHSHAGPVLPFPSRLQPNDFGWSQVSEDERWLCRASRKGLIEIWNLETGTLHQRIQANDRDFLQGFDLLEIIFSRDGRRAVAAGRNQVEFWNLKTGELIHRYEPDPRNMVTKAVLSLDGNTVAISRMDGKLVLTTLDQPAESHVIVYEDFSSQQVVAFDSDGRKLLVARTSHNRHRTEILVYDVNERKMLFRRDDPLSAPLNPLSTVRPEMTTWGPNADEIFLIRGLQGPDGTLIVQNIMTQNEVLSVPISLRPPNDGRYLWDGPRSRIIVYGGEQPVRFYDYPSGKLQVELPESLHTEAFIVLQRPFRNYVYVTSERKKTSTFWDPDGKPATYWRSEPVIGVAEVPERKLLATFSERTIRVYENDHPFETQKVDMPDIAEVKFLSGGNRLLGIGCNRRHFGELGAQLWDFTTGASAHSLVQYHHPGNVLKGMALLADNRLASWGASAVCIWRLDGQGQLLQATVTGQIVGGGIFGESLWTWETSGRLTQWNLADLKPVFSWEIGLVRRALVSPDGQHVLSWDHDFNVTWRSWPANEIEVRYEHQREICDGVLTEDGRMALTWSVDRKCIAWDLVNNRPFAQWTSPVAVQQTVIFGEKNEQVAVFGMDSSVSVGQLALPETIKSLDPLDPAADQAYQALAQRFYETDVAPRQATLRLRAGEKSSIALVSAMTRVPIPFGPQSIDVYGNSTMDSQFYLCADGQRLLRWGPLQSVALSNLEGVQLQAFDHRNQPQGPPGDPLAYFGVLIDESQRRIVTADQSGSIRLWRLPNPLPATPAIALLDLELRCKYHVDRFGQIQWLNPEEIATRALQLRESKR